MDLTLCVSWEMDSFQQYHPFERMILEVWVPFDFSKHPSLRRNAEFWFGDAYMALWEECSYQHKTLRVSELLLEE